MVVLESGHAESPLLLVDIQVVGHAAADHGRQHERKPSLDDFEGTRHQEFAFKPSLLVRPARAEVRQTGKLVTRLYLALPSFLRRTEQLARAGKRRLGRERANLHSLLS